MPDNDDAITRFERDGFGDKAHLAEVKVTGSGISETLSLSVNVTHCLDRLNQMPPPWTENRDMIVKLFTPLLQSSFNCPGQDDERCCRAVGDLSCFPNWREREDPEWYARAIHVLLSQVNARIGQEGPLVPALAADEGFELGCLLTEALIKFRWDKHAKRGKKTITSASRGGSERRKRPSAEITVQRVDELIAQGKSLTRAYALVASEQEVTAQTVGKEYRKVKKQV